MRLLIAFAVGLFVGCTMGITLMCILAAHDDDYWKD